MTETSSPATLGDTRARYRQIAPEPSPEAPDVARQLARALLVSALRRNHRLTDIVLSAGEVLNADELAALAGEFTAVHLLHAMITGTGESVHELAAQVTGAVRDGGGIGEFLWEAAQALAVDADEVNRLAGSEARITAAARDKELADVKGACALLARVASEQQRTLYAAWVDANRDDAKALRETIVTSQEDLADYDGARKWDGTETGGQWYSRTWDPETAGAGTAGMARELAAARRKLSAVRELCAEGAGTVTVSAVLEAAGPEPENGRQPGALPEREAQP
jgi:hypothetical protein